MLAFNWSEHFCLLTFHWDDEITFLCYDFLSLEDFFHGKRKSIFGMEFEFPYHKFIRAHTSNYLASFWLVHNVKFVGFYQFADLFHLNESIQFNWHSVPCLTHFTKN